MELVYMMIGICMTDENIKRKIYESAKLTFTKLNLKPGNIVIIQFPHDIEPIQIYTTIECIRPLAEDFGVSLISLSNGIALSQVTEQEMKTNGWIRDPHFIKNESTALN